MGAGLYSVDEVFSPVQLVIDDEFIDHLARLAREMSVTEESLALDEIEEVGPGGIFTDRMHTAEHFRDEIWMPKLFSHESYESWVSTGGETLRAKALEVWRQAMAESHPRGMKPETEKALLELIQRAGADLVS